MHGHVHSWNAMASLSGAVLLLGAPGVGKSSLGTVLLSTHNANAHEFVNVGKQLRATPTSKRQLSRAAEEILSSACARFQEHVESRSGMPRVLLLECVKELEDAFMLMRVLDAHHIKLQQVLYLAEQDSSNRSCRSATELLQQCLSTVKANDSTSNLALPTCSAAYRHTTALRKQKWQRNEAALIQFFSSLGVLAEVSAWELPDKAAEAAAHSKSGAAAAAAKNSALDAACINSSDTAVSSSSSGGGGGGNSSQTGSNSSSDTHPINAPLQPPKGTLAAIGYAASSSPGSLWLAKVGWCSSDTGSLHAVNALQPSDRRSHAYGTGPYSYTVPLGKRCLLMATHIQPVVSPPPVTSVAERQHVLEFSASCTGLYNNGSSSSSSTTSANAKSSSTSSSTSSSSTSTSNHHKVIPVPLQSIATEADAHWVGVPGRYMVSLKCDGTRFLLVAMGDPGLCYLINRAGMVYRCPYDMSSSTASAASGAAGQQQQVNTTSSCASSSTSRRSGSAQVQRNTGHVSSACAGTVASEPTGSSSNNNSSTAQAEPKAALPAGTVLDGELVWHRQPVSPGGTAAGQQGHFLVFDALSINNRPVWQLPLPDRLSALKEQLQLPEISTASAASAQPHPVATQGRQLSSSSGSCSSGGGGGEGITSTSTSTSSNLEPEAQGRPFSMKVDVTPGTTGLSNAPFRNGPINSGRPNLQVTVNTNLIKKQQAAPGPDNSITLLYKPHYEVSSATLQQLHAALRSGNVPFPTDGLIFTPTAMPYTLGMQELLFKWQPRQQTGADITGQELQRFYRPGGVVTSFGQQGIIPSIIDMRAADYIAQEWCSSLEQLPKGLVYECVPLTTADITNTVAANSISTSTRQQQGYRMPGGRQPPVVVWLPQSVRWDKAAGNSSSTLQQLHERLQPLGSPLSTCMSHKRLMHAVWQVQHYTSSRFSTTITDRISGSPAAAVAAAASAGPCAAATAASRASSSPESAALSTDPPATAVSTCISTAASTFSQHPAKAMPFEQLYEALQEAMAAGTVESSVDEASGLQVFCYNMDRGAPSSPIAAMSRGLVLHPDSRTVVATPFVRFDDLRADQVGLPAHPAHILEGRSTNTAPTSRPQASRGTPDISNANTSKPSSLTAAQAKKKNTGQQKAALKLQRAPPQSDLQSSDSQVEPARAGHACQQLYQSWASQPRGSASFKLDSSLIIAFVWQGRLYTCTRRRMDSEQAVWARTWLQQHVGTDSLQPGWTYLFEAIYRENTHVIQYPFEALVLLGAVDPSGAELPSVEARQQLAQQLGVVAAPSIAGRVPELTLRLARGCRALQELEAAAGSTSGRSRVPGSKAKMTLEEFRGVSSSSSKGKSSKGFTPASFEGWVVQDHSTHQRYKLVQQAFKQTGDAASTELHPLVVWGAVHAGKSRAEIMQGLPDHYLTEMEGILAALEQQFWAVQQQLDADLQHAWFDAAACTRQVCHTDGAAAPACSTAEPAAPATSVPAMATPCHVSSTAESATVGAPVGSGTKAARGRVSGAAAGASTLGSSSSSSNADPPDHTASVPGVYPQEYAEALQYALQKGTAKTKSMFMQEGEAASSSNPAPSLRGLLLSCIKPSTNGTLPGYTPSAAFLQTYCKGWVKGPRQGRMSVLDPEPLVLNHLTDQGLMAVLGRLQGRDIGRALLTCRAWYQLLQGDAGFQEKARQGAARRAAAYYQRPIYSFQDVGLSRLLGLGLGGYSQYDDSDDEGYGFSGYGSP